MRTILLTIVLAVACHLAGAQTVRRVNNNFGVTGLNVYGTPQAAHDAAAANDILIIEPSLTAYGDLTLTKPLKVYGNGFFLTSNPELRVDQRTSTLGTVIFNTGSNESYIAGLVVSTVYTRGVSNITITRCYVTNELYVYDHNLASVRTNVTGIVISSNYLGSSISCSVAAPYTLSNISATNNILRGLTASGNEIQGWIVRHNTFHNDGNGITLTLFNSVFENNILSNPATGGGNYALSFTNTTASFNVSHSNTFALMNGNQNNVDFTIAFVDPTGLSADEQYQLKNSSPLKTAGSASSEVGAFGGPTPYVISGIPPIPSVTDMVNTATGSDAVELEVTISVKSNN